MICSAYMFGFIVWSAQRAAPAGVRVRAARVGGARTRQALAKHKQERRLSVVQKCGTYVCNICSAKQHQHQHNCSHICTHIFPHPHTFLDDIFVPINQPTLPAVF
jgi:hypothetical protein